MSKRSGVAMVFHQQFLFPSALRAGLALGVLLAAAPISGCSEDDSSSTGGTGSGTGGHHSGSGGTPAATGGGTGGGAGEGGSGAASEEAASTVGDRRIPYTPADDAAFAAFFAEHHRMAIHMAELEIDNGSDPGVKKMATDMRESQSAELRVLQAIVDELGTDEPPTPADPHHEAELTAMQSLSGADLDTMFLIEMIPHHAAGLAPAHRALENLQRSELEELALHIIDVQAAEIGAMKAMLSEKGVNDPGEDRAGETTSRVDFGLVGDRRITLTPDDDLGFIDFFVPHHRMAVEMAEREIAQGHDADIKQMARDMRDSQQSEIDMMLAARKELVGSDAVPSPPDDPHMLAESKEMAGLSGGDLDHMFLAEMIPHHAAALPTAHRAKPHLTRSDLQQLAENIVDAQAREIGDMHAMLQNQ